MMKKGARLEIQVALDLDYEVILEGRIVTAKKGIYLFACKARHNDYTLDYINKEDI